MQIVSNSTELTVVLLRFTLGGISQGDRAPKGGGLSPREMFHSCIVQAHIHRGWTLLPKAPTPVVMPSRVLRSQRQIKDVLRY